MLKKKILEKIKTQILRSITLFRKSRCLWDNMERYGTARQVTDDKILWCIRFACWIAKATNTHSECEIRIACAQQQWLCECASMLPYTYVALSCFFFFLGPVCISSGSTAAFKAYCAYLKLLTAQIHYPCGSYEETKVPK
jgi:hypothetical protein